MAEYTKEQLEELYKQLPEDLQEAVYSEEIGKKVQEICYDNNAIENEAYIEILKNVGYVFLGLLTISDLKDKLKDSEEIFTRINNEIFAELKDSLEDLYGTKIKFEKIEEKPKKPKRADNYLEPIE